MGKFRQILTKLSARDTLIVSFRDDNLSKCQGFLTKYGTCIDIKEIWFGIANKQISFFLFFFFFFFFDRVICPWNNNGGVLSFKVLILIVYSGQATN